MQVYPALILNISIEYRPLLLLLPSQCCVRISSQMKCSSSFYRLQNPDPAFHEARFGQSCGFDAMDGHPQMGTCRTGAFSADREV